MEPPGLRFRKLLDCSSILQLPNAHNGLAAVRAREDGFRGVYLSGVAIATSMGLSDLSVVAIDEVNFLIRQIARACTLPILVDGNSYRDSLSIENVILSFEESGAAAVQLNDRSFPNKFTHIEYEKLASPEQMATKIAAATATRQHLYIIVRTDAAASEGIDGAVARANLYREAGADAVSPGALRDAEMFREFARRMLGVKLLAETEVAAATAHFSASEFESMGYAMIIRPPSDSGPPAGERNYAVIEREEVMAARNEFYSAIDHNFRKKLAGLFVKADNEDEAPSSESDIVRDSGAMWKVSMDDW